MQLDKILEMEYKTRSLVYLKELAIRYIFENIFERTNTGYYYDIRNRIVKMKGKRELLSYVHKLYSLF